MLALKQAISARWTAASLHSSIATLYHGDDEASPETTVMPRASYEVTDDRQTGRSRGHRINMASLVFHVYATTDLLAEGYLDSIDAAFVNGEQAATSAMQVSGSAGHIMDADFVGRTVVQEEDSVWHGIMTMDVHYTKPNTVPA